MMDEDEYINETLRARHRAADRAECDSIIILLLTVAAAFYLTLRYLV
jgi:hypothetical protein